MYDWQPHDNVVVRWCWRAAVALGRHTIGWRARVLVSLFFRARLRCGGHHSVCASRLASQFRDLPDFVSLPEEWFVDRPIVWARRGGIVWQFDLRDNLQCIFYFTGNWEGKTVGAIGRAMGADGVLVDVGAHIGVHSLRLADRGGRRQVIAFEPASDSVAKIRTAARLNGRRVTVVKAALGARRHVAALSDNPTFLSHDAGVRSLHGHGKHVEWVQVVRFDDWLEEHPGISRVDVVKIDVEGSELSVLEGMMVTVARHRPSLIVMEWSPTLLRRAQTSTDEVTRLLDSIGYVRDPNVIDRNVFFSPQEWTRRAHLP